MIKETVKITDFVIILTISPTSAGAEIRNLESFIRCTRSAPDMQQIDTCTDRMPTINAVRIPKGKGRRGEGIRTAERRPGQSCERWSGVDSEMLSSHDGHLALSEFAFVLENDMDDAAFEAEGAPPPRVQHAGVAPRDRSKALSPTDVITPFNQRRSPGSLNSDDLHYKSSPPLPSRPQPRPALSYHDEDRWSTGGWEDRNPFLPPSMQIRLSPGKDQAGGERGGRDDRTRLPTTNKATYHDDGGSPPFKNEGRWAPPKGTPVPLVRDQDTLVAYGGCFL